LTWNFLQIELVPEDRLIRPMYGPGGLDRAGALAEVQSILDREPLFVKLAASWRKGAKDDTVFALPIAPFAWAIYEYDGDDPLPGAHEWLADFAATMRRMGFDAQIAQLP
jgi:hypothetical protein